MRFRRASKPKKSSHAHRYVFWCSCGNEWADRSCYDEAHVLYFSCTDCLKNIRYQEAKSVEWLSQGDVPAPPQAEVGDRWNDRVLVPSKQWIPLDKLFKAGV